MADLKTKILENIAKAQNNEVYNSTFYKDDAKSLKNEFLFFIKPEITMQSSNIKLDEVIALILDKIAAFGLTIRNASVLSAKYLEEHNIIAQHYGVINKLSSDIQKNISAGAKTKFEEIYKVKFDDSEVLGSLEFIKEFNEFTPLTLDYLWQNGKFEKLAGGTYCLALNFNGRQVYLINGFHPRQLDHFTQNGRSIITMTLTSDMDWETARGKFIGATNPDSAENGSLRKAFKENESKLGLPAISSSWNGVHLSAGPVEGLVELIRYNSDFSSKNIQKLTDYSFGRQLLEAFGGAKAEKILENVDVTYSGDSISVFDLTEEKNSNEAIELLEKAQF